MASKSKSVDIGGLPTAVTLLKIYWKKLLYVF